MVMPKDRNYKSLRPVIQLELPPDEDAGIAAVGYIDKMSIDEEDRRLMFEALGYIPYLGGNTHVGKLTKVTREPQWEIARRIHDKRSA